MRSDKEVKFEIINIIGTISEGKGGWNKLLTRVSWGGNEPKYDIRTWSPDHTKMGKGITLSEEELRSLSKLTAEELDFLENDD